MVVDSVVKKVDQRAALKAVMMVEKLVGYLVELMVMKMVDE